MKIKGMLLAAVCMGAMSLTSCKKETTETTTTTDSTTVVTESADTNATEPVDETGAKDTISITTDTVTVKKP